MTTKQNNFGIKNTAIKNGKVCIIVNYYDDNGKRKQFCHTTDILAKDVGRGRKKEVEKLRDEIVAQFYKEREEHKKQEKDKSFYIKQEISFINLLYEYLNAKYYKEDEREAITEQTYNGYKHNINVITSFLEERNLQDVLAKDVSTDLIEDLFKYITNRKTSNNKKITKNTVRHYYQFINPAFNYGVKKKYISYNPAVVIEPPSVGKPKINYLKPNECRIFIKECQKDLELGFAYIIDLIYGLRRSELLGLTWDKIDFENKTITISSALHRIGTKFSYKDELKTLSSIATFPFVDGVEKILMAKKLDIEKNKALLGNSYINEYSNFVFVDNTGDLIKPDRLSRNVHRICENADITDIHFHGLRHTCASNLLANGASLKEVQEWLRHSNFNTTADFYVHLSIQQKQTIGKRVSNMLSLNEEIENICNSFNNTGYDKTYITNNSRKIDFDNSNNESCQNILNELMQ